MGVAGCERYSNADTMTQIADDIRRGLLEAIADAEGTADASAHRAHEPPAERAAMNVVSGPPEPVLGRTMTTGEDAVTRPAPARCTRKPAS